MFKYSLTVSAIIFASQSFAMSDAELSKAMNKDIQNYMATVKAPKLFFHWVDASDITPKGQFNSEFPTNSPQFKDYVSKQGGAIFNQRSSKDNDYAGQGLYLASDPLLSRAYGGKKTFGLIVGLVRPGAKVFLDNAQLINNERISVSDIDSLILNEVATRNCKIKTYTDLLNSVDPMCTKVKQLLVGKDTSFANGRFYAWESWKPTRSSYCNSSSFGRDITIPQSFRAKYKLQNLNTIVAYNASMFSEIVGITHMTTKGSTPLASQILSFLKDQTYKTNDLASAVQKSSPHIKSFNADEIKNFGSKYILDCVN